MNKKFDNINHRLQDLIFFILKFGGLEMGWPRIKTYPIQARLIFKKILSRDFQDQYMKMRI